MRLELKCSTPGCNQEFSVDWPEHADGKPIGQITIDEYSDEIMVFEDMAKYPEHNPISQTLIPLLIHHGNYRYERKTTRDYLKYGHGTFRGGRSGKIKVSAEAGILIIEGYR